jgi:UDP-N-acetylmuramate dehydrogenase
MVLGGGSNLLFAADPQQTLLALTGRRVELLHERTDAAIVHAEAGADWHPFVMWTLEQGLSGLQNLALIPGTVGAAPIQNIGAYGVEVGEFVHAVVAFERASGRMQRLDRDACRFGYRDSRFKQQSDAWIVTAVEFELPRRPALQLDYAGLGDELAAMGIADPTPRQIADAVIRIRRRKLPDPARIGNAGSFFKNPIVAAAAAEALRAQHPSLPVFPAAPFPADAGLHGETGKPDLRKLSAAWLIEQCGWKGHRDGDAGVSDQHALVLVNHGGASGAALLGLARRIADSVQARFGVAIEPEPRIVGDDW